LYFFFSSRRRHTRFSRDWSSDVCSSDLTDVFQIRATIYGDEGDAVFFPVVQRCGDTEHAWIAIPADGQDPHDLEEPAPGLTIAEIGRASCRERVEISVDGGVAAQRTMRW